MTLLAPPELPDCILTLIDSCRTDLTIVAPRPKIARWKRLRQRLKRARQRGVRIVWYYHGDQLFGQRCRRLGIEGRSVDDLRCRIYLSEDRALTTTMSLHKETDDTVIDIGYLTDTPAEYAAVTDFVGTYIDPVAVAETGEPLSLKVLHAETGSKKAVVSRVVARLHDFADELLRSGRVTADQVRHTLQGVAIEDFHPGIALLVEARKAADVVILQPRGSRAARAATLGYLSYYPEVFAAAVGHPFTIGKRGKRLKCALPTTHRQLDAEGRLQQVYVHQLERALASCFAGLRDNLRAMLAQEYHLVG